MKYLQINSEVAKCVKNVTKIPKHVNVSCFKYLILSFLVTLQDDTIPPLIIKIENISFRF